VSGPATQDWIEPYAGLSYQPRAMTVAAQDQQRLLRLCGIDPAVFGDHIDPAAFITLAIQEGVRNRVHANGTVNLAQRLAQHRPLILGEPLTVTGRILDVQEVPRGRVATSETWFSGADGLRAVTSGRLSLRPGPSMASASGTGERQAPVIASLEGLRELGSSTMTPEGVKAYTGPENPIHFDPEVARAKGFRAPIVGGGQCVRFLTAAIWRRFAPRTLDLEIFFWRPVFWDDTVTVMADEQDGRWKAVCLVANGKVTTEARITDLTA
jgi:hypothetical protein